MRQYRYRLSGKSKKQGTKRTGNPNTKPLGCIRLRPLGFEMLEDRRLLSGQAVSLSVTAPTIAIAGSPFEVTIRTLDQNGQLVKTYSGSADLSSSDNDPVLISAASVNLINGTAMVPVTLNSPNTLTLRATAGTVTGTSDSVDVTPPVSAFAVSAPTQAIAGGPFTISVQALRPIRQHCHRIFWFC